MLESIIISLSIGYAERRISWTQPSEDTGYGRCEWIHRSKYTAGRLELSASFVVHWFSTGRGQRPRDVQHRSIFLITATVLNLRWLCQGRLIDRVPSRTYEFLYRSQSPKPHRRGCCFCPIDQNHEKTRDNATVNRLQQPNVSRCT